MGAMKKIGRALSSISRKSSIALKRAAMKRDEMDRAFDRVFGPNALRDRGFDGERVRAEAAASTPSSARYFHPKEDQVDEKNFFEKPNKKKKIDIW